jgi:hypothetical protein
MPNIVLTPARKSELAILMVRQIIREKGVSTFKRSELKRSLGETAKAIGAEIDELLAYYEEEVRNLVNEVFKSDFIPGRVVPGPSQNR